MNILFNLVTILYHFKMHLMYLFDDACISSYFLDIGQNQEIYIGFTVNLGLKELTKLEGSITNITKQ